MYKVCKVKGDVCYSIPTCEYNSDGQPVRTYSHQLCADTGYNLENLLGAIDDRDGWRENQENPHYQHNLMMMTKTQVSSHAIYIPRYIYIYIYI